MADDDDFAAERERIEEKHRIEVLNLLKSFEFERKDIETRLRAEFEEAGAESSQNTSAFMQELEEYDDRLGDSTDDELRKRFEQEKEKFLVRINELENEISGGREEEDYQEEGIENIVIGIRHSCFHWSEKYDWIKHPFQSPHPPKKKTLPV